MPHISNEELFRLFDIIRSYENLVEYLKDTKVKGINSLDELDLLEKEFIEKTLFSNDNNTAKSARHLGITRSTLYSKMEKYNIVQQKRIREEIETC